MARTTLPTFPLIVFGVIELALLYHDDGHGFSPEALGVTLQLVNALLLLAPMAVVACFSRDPATAKGYLFAVALADYGHIYATYRAVGADVFFNSSLWNDMVGANIASSAVLNVLRLLTLLGVFGPVVARDRDADGGGKKKKKKAL
ncbi:hypothetical protein N658DRAFT_570136 [Parathielavia hyrcaniae]|uniref:DUF7704 domain-containing protein n=1 Tax=Parathielavia hyrcaniae TaxID=113614 RepID=A0AAN6SWR9_9PEZI|nr:hypothetical protein N658DRAFT_570136 [Parathielavia hyrcaniae]